MIYKEKGACPGDDALELKTAMFLNALASQEDSEKAHKTGEPSGENADDHFKKVRAEDCIGGHDRKPLVKDKWNL